MREQTEALTMPFDPASQDVGNIVSLEHVNLTVPNQETATDFYIDGLGLTRDPYLMAGTDNMWVNCGRHQFHLPKGDAQRWRGCIGLRLPCLDALEKRLGRIAPKLEGSLFRWQRKSPKRLDLRCPWGNRFRIHGDDAKGRAAGTCISGKRPTSPALVYLEMPVRQGDAAKIEHFYRKFLKAPGRTEKGRASINAGPGQQLIFVEQAQAIEDEYDGHHFAIYIADFSGTYHALAERGLITDIDNAWQFRFIDIGSGRNAKPLFRVEHEVRSLNHPLYQRALVNRLPEEPIL
ncbi:glyoxalase/bleomycin resistance/dioxygenase family protein [Thioalkalivibrio sp. HK1]|uniref:glyoxalase/bleomycin resistance/dioxygenase family protein n=1 Tax=Thioalkalivibrio sp. HK1 TaxID=1469245 RepID=UPI0004B7E664|nr:glyoxalase/bleomycin resistance/dioxygenase family protein [Thioalkalivibrio sp. HK1]